MATKTYDVNGEMIDVLPLSPVFSAQPDEDEDDIQDVEADEEDFEAEDEEFDTEDDDDIDYEVVEDDEEEDL